MLDAVQNWGAVLLPVFLYLIYHKHYLNQKELILLLINCFMLIALLVGGWVTSISYLIGIGYHHLVLMEAARSTHLFQRASQVGSEPSWIQKIFTTGQNQLKLWIYLIYFWILVRMTSLRSISFDIEGRGTFVGLMAGWNCLLPDWHLIYGLWLILLVLAMLAAVYLIAREREGETLYKQYLLKCKIGFDLIITLVIVGYNYYAHSQSQSLGQCLSWYQWGGFVRCLWMWGIPLTTLYFFYCKQGVFEERGTTQTDGQSQQERQLNEIIIDREYQKVRTSLKNNSPLLNSS